MSSKEHKLSVVIASVNGLPIIGECLYSLHQQSLTESLEIIVVNRRQDGVSAFVREKYPAVKFIEASEQTTIPQLRATGFRQATGDLIAVLEDHCIVEPDWARMMIEAHRKEYPVIGGSVENGAFKRLTDWAAFFCEYSQAMKPLPEGEVDAVPGNNVSYKKWVVDQFQYLIEAGVWDSTLHEQMRKENIPLYSMPIITVHHKLTANLGWFLSQKFHFARSFAATRFNAPSWSRRAFYTAAAVLLPVILGKRIVSRVWQKKVHRGELIKSSPILMLLLLSWGAGEMMGYCLGPGSSSTKVC